jgi:hypothetical protein
MESFVMADTNFDFIKHLTFTDEEIKQALQKGLESPTSPFTMPDGASFDYSSFFEEEQKEARNDGANIKNEEDQPMPSIESTETAVDAPVSTQVEDAAEQSNQTATAPVQSVQNDHLPSTSLGAEVPLMTGLKDDSADPLLFNLDSFDDLFTSNDHSMTQFEEVNPMPALASPFQIPEQRADAMPDFPMHNQNARQMLPPQPHMIGNGRLAAHHFPTGRRRSQTLPPDFEPGISFQRRMTNGMPIPQGRLMHPHTAHQSFPPHPHNAMRGHGRFGPEAHMMGMPHSYPVTPPPRHPTPMMMQHDYINASRPRSLNPDLRMSLMSRPQDASPYRGRCVKRQKQSHDRSVPTSGPLPHLRSQDVDFGGFGMDQAMAAVEFLLRDTAEKAKYARDDEVERYVPTIWVLS